MLWRNWVEESGADFCVKQAELDEQTSDQVLGLDKDDFGSRFAAFRRSMPHKRLARPCPAAQLTCRVPYPPNFTSLHEGLAV